MILYSTKNRSHQVTLREAVIRGLAPDNGLYMPTEIRSLPRTFFGSLPERSFQEISFDVAKHLIGDSLPEQELKRIVDHTIQFDAPLVEVEKNIFALELFHGPTLAFKDFGARFMSQLLGYFAKEEKKQIVILAATSGDTGSAVANGFLGVNGTRVIVLYPKGKVSLIQEKQFTTLGQNVTAIEVDGTFDDCQSLVKKAFQDENLRAEFFLTSANSINIARLIPQSFYYFYAVSRLMHLNKPIVFSVPSGNFGNLTGGLLAQKMGLPIDHFVVATNKNDVVPEYLKTKEFKPRPSIQTISNAMDVGNPSNFERILEIFGHDFERISNSISGYGITDDETRLATREVKSKSQYILDPHGAVGYAGLKKYLHSSQVGVFLETAHPAKFLEVVEETLEEKIQIPETLQRFMSGKKQVISMTNDFARFKQLLTALLTV
ncbi:MAG TPA: threonine synthase [Chryseosolibacter sp.]